MGGKGGSEKQVVGYRYYLGMHMILCSGPIDGIKQIWVEDTIIWPNSKDNTAVQADGANSAVINEPSIFGGDDKEGGIAGTIDFEYGEASQAVNSYLVSKLDPANGRVPAFRGLVGAVLRQIYLGTSPYIKPCGFLCKRTAILQDGSQQWYLSKADISGDLNPAHIIRECLTSSIFGLGYSTAYIDDDSFEYAAETLYTEAFGLSFLWDNDISIEDFVNSVLNHINAVLYQDTETGKFVLKLIRDDYVAGNLDVFDDSSIVEIKEYTRESYGEVVNQIVVKYCDEVNNKEATATAQDIAVMNLQGGALISATMNYSGITKAALATKVAARELSQATSMLARMTIVGNRTMHTIRPGDVFKITWPILDIEETIVRVLQVNYGKLTEGLIEFSVVEDIFAAATALTADAPDSEWENPVSEPENVTANLLMEVPYYSLARIYGESYAEALDADAGFIGAAVLKPSSDSFDYELWVRDGLAMAFTLEGRGSFTPTATLDAALLCNAADATIDLNNVQDLDMVVVDTYAVIGNEIVKVKDVDTALNQVTIARGCLDTIPAAHNGGDRIWFVESVSKLISREYADSEQPGVKYLPLTGKGQLGIDEATAYNANAMDSRQVRPYLPGDFKINGVSYPTTFGGEPVLTWKHRNRLTQTAYIVEHSETTITPVEAGLTYTLLIYGNSGVLKRTVTGITGETYTYADADEKADNGGNLNTTLRFVLKAVRGIYDSWQSYDITVTRV